MSSTSLFIQWNPIPPQPVQVISYLVRLVSVNDTSQVHTKIVNSSDMSMNVTFEGLDKYSIYSVVVLGRSRSSDGIPSQPVILYTAEDGEMGRAICFHFVSFN